MFDELRHRDMHLNNSCDFKKAKPLRLFCSGSAGNLLKILILNSINFCKFVSGTGKSFLIETISLNIKRMYSESDNFNYGQLQFLHISISNIDTKIKEAVVFYKGLLNDNKSVIALVARNVDVDN